NCSFGDESMFLHSMKKVNDLLYLETKDSILYAFNVSNTTAPTFEGDFSISGYESEIKVYGNFAVAVEGSYLDKILVIYNITSFDSITLVDSYNISGYETYRFEAFQDIIFVSEYNDFLVFDWSDPTNITYITLIDPPYFKKVGFNTFWMLPSMLLVACLVRKRKLKR
ncbi:MAG: hypothetical protein ACTSP7_12495, partial [Candidatus Heimdallarchaeota archaeon]